MFLNQSNHIRRYFSLLLVLGFALPITCQKIDSLKAVVSSSIPLAQKEKALWFLMEEIAWTEAEYSESLGDSLMLLDHVRSDSALIIRVLQSEGKTQRAVGNYVNSLKIYKCVYDYRKRNKDTLNMAIAGSQLGIMNLFNGNMTIAQNYLLEAHDFYLRKGSKVQVADSNNALASFYSSMEQVDKSFERYHLALKAYEEAKDTNGMANVHANLGLAYTEEGDYDKAEFHLRNQGHLDSLLNSPYGLGFHFDFLGYLYQKKGDLEKAYQNHLIALEIREGLHSHYNRDESRISVSSMLNKMGRYEEAIRYAEKIFDNVDLQHSLTHQQSAHEILSESHKALGNYKLSLQHHEEFKNISDSIYNKEQLDQITEKDAKFERAEQENKIALLNAEKSATDKILRQKNRTIALGGISLLLISLLSFALYRLLGKVNVQKGMLTGALKDKDVLIKEIHHRVKNNLQLVSSLLSLQSKTIDDPTVAGAIQAGKSRVRSMALIHQDLYQRDNLTAVNVNSYLEELCTELLDTYNIDDSHIELNLDIVDINLDIDTIIPLGLIINELITNSIKYAFPNGQKGNINVELRHHKEKLILKVEDDGVGYEAGATEKSGSFGTTLIKALSKQLKGYIDVNVTNGTRTEIEFHKFDLA